MLLMSIAEMKNSSPYNPGIVVNFLFVYLVYSFSKNGRKKIA